MSSSSSSSSPGPARRVTTAPAPPRAAPSLPRAGGRRQLCTEQEEAPWWSDPADSMGSATEGIWALQARAGHCLLPPIDRPPRIVADEMDAPPLILRADARPRPPGPQQGRRAPESGPENPGPRGERALAGRWPAFLSGRGWPGMNFYRRAPARVP